MLSVYTQGLVAISTVVGQTGFYLQLLPLGDKGSGVAPASGVALRLKTQAARSRRRRIPARIPSASGSAIVCTGRFTVSWIGTQLPPQLFH